MNRTHYPFALIISLCLFALCLSFQNRGTRVNTATKILDPFLSLQEPLQKIDTLTLALQDKIARLDEIIREYERINRENQALRDEKEGFWEFMEQQYDFEGHNELYERTH